VRVVLACLPYKYLTVAGHQPVEQVRSAASRAVAVGTTCSRVCRRSTPRRQAAVRSRWTAHPIVALGQELRHGAAVGPPRVRVAGVRREEFQGAARSAAAAINADNPVVIGAIWFITMGRAAVTCETMEHASRRCYASPPRGRLPPIFSSRRQAEAVVRRRWPDRYVPGSSPAGAPENRCYCVVAAFPEGASIHDRTAT